MTAILDTSFLFALADQSDRNHDHVLAVAQIIGETLLLPIVVLSKVCYLISSRLGHQAMRRFLVNLTASSTQLEPIKPTYLGRVNQILEQYADVNSTL